MCKQAVKDAAGAYHKFFSRQSANWFRLVERDRIPVNAKYSMPRVSFDGLNVKDLAICSCGHVYKNINKTSRQSAW